MQGRYFDGQAPVARPVRVEIDGEALSIHVGDAPIRWPLDRIEAEALGVEVRLRPGGAAAARLLLRQDDWRAVRGSRASAGRLQRGRERRLVLGLALVAIGVIGFVFGLIPAVSGPLAARTPPQWERQIGDNLDSQVSLGFPRCSDGPGQSALAAFGERLQHATATPFEVRVRAVHAPIANAFALPGGVVLVTGDLIELAKTPDELSAVIAHEVAHVERRHVMQGVWRSLGLGLVLDAVVGGGTGAGQQAVLLMGSVTDLRFSRRAESEADARGQELLESVGLASTGMAPFFHRLAAAGEGAEARAVKELLSDHPDTERRAQAAAARARSGPAAFSAEEWAAVKAACGDKPARLKRLQNIF